MTIVISLPSTPAGNARGLIEYVGVNDSHDITSERLVKGEIRVIGFDWTNYLGSKSTTISSSTWAVENTSSIVGLSGNTNLNGITTTTCTASAQGRATIKNTVTLASGERLVRKRYLTVTDPEVGTGFQYQ